jgi:hypothetical protein
MNVWQIFYWHSSYKIYVDYIVIKYKLIFILMFINVKTLKTDLDRILWLFYRNT